MPEIVGEPLRQELNFTFPLGHKTEVMVLRERITSVAVDKVNVVGKTTKMDNISLPQMINRIPLLNYRYLGSFPSDIAPVFTNDTFAFINTQASYMHFEHWKMIANSRQKLYFGDYLGGQKYKFLKQL